MPSRRWGAPMHSKALLYIRTIWRMKPGMVAARLRGQRRVSERSVAGKHAIRMPSLAVPELDLDPAYLARFDAAALMDGEFLLINERHGVNLGTWSVSEASHLWNFNLHYFEWSVALAARYRETEDRRWLDCFKRLVASWMDACSYPQDDAWHPYTISLRLVNWLVALDLFGETVQEDRAFFARMLESMYLQYRHLLANRELHLRANHYWENVKTLVVCAAAFGEQRELDRALCELEEQLDEQVLPDGMHFERSLMYHKLVLEGMLRVYLTSDQLGFDLPDSFMPKLKAMLDAMASLERGMGKTPFFNDSADGVAKECRQLVAACSRRLGLEADDSIAAFPDAGYYKLYDGDMAVMFDAGEPGPSYMLGHAHCDCLSFEMSYRGKPVVVNSGTYSYQSELRPYFRSTAAHNTCVVDGEEQLECWGEHRVGRGYRSARVVEFDEKRIVAELELASGMTQTRWVSISGDSLDIEDFAVSRRDARLETYVQFVSQEASRVEVKKGHVTQAQRDYAPVLGVLRKAAACKAEGVGAIALRVLLSESKEADDA